MLDVLEVYEDPLFTGKLFSLHPHYPESKKLMRTYIQVLRMMQTPFKERKDLKVPKGGRFPVGILHSGN